MVSTPDLRSAPQDTAVPSVVDDPGLTYSDGINFTDPNQPESANPYQPEIPVDIERPEGPERPELPDISEPVEPEPPIDIALGFTATVLATFIALMAVWAVQQGIEGIANWWNTQRHANSIVDGMDPTARAEANTLAEHINNLRGLEEQAQRTGNESLEDRVDGQAADAMEGIATILRDQASVIGQNKGDGARKAALTLADFISENAKKVRNDQINIPRLDLRRRAGNEQGAEVAALETLQELPPQELYDLALEVLDVEAGTPGTDLQVAETLREIGLPPEAVSTAIAQGSPVAAELGSAEQTQYVDRVIDSSAALVANQTLDAGDIAAENVESQMALA